MCLSEHALSLVIMCDEDDCGRMATALQVVRTHSAGCVHTFAYFCAIVLAYLSGVCERGATTSVIIHEAQRVVNRGVFKEVLVCLKSACTWADVDTALLSIYANTDGMDALLDGAESPMLFHNYEVRCRHSARCRFRGGTVFSTTFAPIPPVQFNKHMALVDPPGLALHVPEDMRSTGESLTELTGVGDAAYNDELDRDLVAQSQIWRSGRQQTLSAVSAPTAYQVSFAQPRPTMMTLTPVEWPR